MVVQVIYRNIVFAIYFFVLFCGILVTCTEAKVRIQTNSDISQQTEDQNITVYNQNKVLIKEKRLFDLKQGVNCINWNNIANTIDIHSVRLSNFTSKPIEVIEQTYQQNPILDRSNLLSYCIGKTVYFRRFLNDGKSEEQSGIVLGSVSNPCGYVIKIGDRYVLDPTGQLEITELPLKLLSQQSNLSFTLKADEAGENNLLLTYEANNMNWQCDYILSLNSEQNQFDLMGWVTLTNQCGLNFKNANLKLIAGNLQTINNPSSGLFAATTIASSDRVYATERSFADYHVYTFPDKISINDNEIKRLNLIERKAILVRKKYIFDQQYYVQTPAKSRIPVQVMLEFQNDQKFKQPFPMGDARVYQMDADNDLQLIGEDRILHTSVGEKVKIKLGDAFDVVGERTHLNSEQIDIHHRKETFKVLLSNCLDKEIVVTDIEHVPDFAKFQSDLSFAKINSSSFQFDVAVPANGTAEVFYTFESAF